MAKNFGEQAREDKPDDSNYEKQIKAEQESYAKIYEENRELLKKYAEEFGFSSVDELVKRYGELEKMREECGDKKSFDSGKLLSEKDNKIYNHMLLLHAAGTSVLARHEWNLQDIENANEVSNKNKRSEKE